MPLRKRARVGGDRDDEWWRADLVLSRAGWSSVCYWEPQIVEGLELAVFLEFHGRSAAAGGLAEIDNVARVRFAYRNPKRETVRFTRVVTADAETTLIDDHGDQQVLSMLPARSNRVVYCGIVPDSVPVRCDHIGDHLFIGVRFVSPNHSAGSSGPYELALRFPAAYAAGRCACCA